MKRMLIMFAALSLGALGQETDPEILEQLIVHSTLLDTWGSSVATVGFPVRRPAGIHHATTLGLLNARGEVVPASFEVAARHNSTPHDASHPIRWLRATLCVNGLSDGDILRLVKRSQQANPVDGKLRDTIFTDQFEVQLQSGTMDLFGTCTSHGKPLVKRPSGRLILEDAQGKSLKPTPWQVEQVRNTNGYNRVVARSSAAGLAIELTMVAINGAGSLRCSLRLINRGPFGFEGRSSAHQNIRRFAITLPCPMGPLRAAMPSARTRLEKDEDFLALMQGHDTTARVGHTDRLWFECRKPSGIVSHGKAAPGLTVLTGSTGQVGLSVERFAETAPKAIAAYPRGFVLDVLPAMGDSSAHHVLQGSRSTTTRFQLSFGNGSDIDLRSLANEVDQVFHLLPSVQRVHEAAPISFPYLPTQPNPSPALQRFERLMRLHVDDAAASPSPSGERIGLPRFLQRGATFRKQSALGWMNFGDVPWGDGYSSLHYDWSFGILLQYIRTGDPRFLTLGRTMARHRASIDQSHDETSDAPWRGGQFYEKGSIHGDTFPPAISHTWIGGSLLDYLLTGDRDSLEAVNLSTDFARRRDLPHWDGRWGARIPGWGADLFLTRYDILRDPADLKTATDILSRVEAIETNRNGKKGFIVNRDAKPPHVKPWMHAILANALARHIVITGSDRFRPLLQRLLTFLRTHAIVRSKTNTFHTYRILHDGHGIQPSTHLNWAMGAAFSWAYAACGNPADAALSRALLADITLRFQGGKPPSPVTFRPMAYPGSESKIFSNIALWGVTGTFTTR